MSDIVCSVVIPVYHSAATLRELHERIHRTFTDHKMNYELILVEDDGRDECWGIMLSLRETNPHVKSIRLLRNFGQHNALMCGFSFARGDYVITLDDDLQNPPEEIPRLLEAIRHSDNDVVFGIPRQRRQSLWRNLGSRLFHRLIAHRFQSYGRSNLRISNVVIMKRCVVEQLLHFSTPYPLVAFLILEITDTIGTIEIEHNARVSGRSTYSTRKLLRSFTQGILYHSFLPLRWICLLGIASFCFGVVLALIYLTLYLFDLITVSGWTTIVLLILFFSSIIMISLGVIGEYLFRIIREIHRTPQYLIRDKEI